MACNDCGARKGHLNGCPQLSSEPGDNAPDGSPIAGRHRKPNRCPSSKRGEHHMHTCTLKFGHKGKHLCAYWTPTYSCDVTW